MPVGRQLHRHSNEQGALTFSIKIKSIISACSPVPCVYGRQCAPNRRLGLTSPDPAQQPMARHATMGPDPEVRFKSTYASSPRSPSRQRAHSYAHQHGRSASAPASHHGDQADQATSPRARKIKSGTTECKIPLPASPVHAQTPSPESSRAGRQLSRARSRSAGRSGYRAAGSVHGGYASPRPKQPVRAPSLSPERKLELGAALKKVASHIPKPSECAHTFVQSHPLRACPTDLSLSPSPASSQPGGMVSPRPPAQEEPPVSSPTPDAPSNAYGRSPSLIPLRPPDAVITGAHT